MAAPHPEKERFDLEREKLAFEVRKFEADQTKRDLEAGKLTEELRDLRRPWFRKPAILVGPLSGVIIAVIAGIVAFSTDVLKMNVVALLNEKATLTAENKKLSNEIAGKLNVLSYQIGASQKLFAQLQDREKIGALAMRGLNGDGKAWDEIIGMERASSDPGVKEYCQSALDTIYSSRLPNLVGAMIWGVDPWVLPLPDGDDALIALKSSDGEKRIAGVQKLKRSKNRSALPQLIELVQRDPFIDVRKASQITVEEISGKSFSHLDYQSMKVWLKGSR